MDEECKKLEPGEKYIVIEQAYFPNKKKDKDYEPDYIPGRKRLFIREKKAETTTKNYNSL